MSVNEHRDGAKRSRGERSCYSRHVSVNEHRDGAKQSRGERSPFIRRRSGVEEAFVLFEGEDNLIDIYLDSLL